MAKKTKKQHHEEHVDESWLIPYADLLTLLLALFIVLFASSQSDKNKMDQMSQVFNDILKGQTGILESMAPFQRIKPDQGETSSGADSSLKQKSGSESQGEDGGEGGLMMLKQEIEEFARNNNLPGYISTSMTGEGLMISIKSIALFPSGSATLLPEAKHIADGIAKLLQNYSGDVVIGGHTDDVPYVGWSNWDLSTTRALAFMKEMLADPKLNPARFSAAGYGEYHPIVPNISEVNRQENRRVEIFVRKKEYKDNP